MSLRERVCGRELFVWDDARTGPPDSGLFEPERWRARGALSGRAVGRGTAYFLTGPDGTPWVLRHNRRGGALARVNHDRFLWTGRARARPGAELRLLATLRDHGLPVPAPVAARTTRGRGCYRGDVITCRIVNARPLAERLWQEPLAGGAWRALGATLARFHRAGIWHGDLNARNVLLDERGDFYLIDFAKARIRVGGAWRRDNLARLRRSLAKCARTGCAFYFTEADWRALSGGYRAA